MTTIKYYVVWKGWETGIYNSWADCQNQTNGFPNAQFKSYKTRNEAEIAFSGSYANRNQLAMPTDSSPISNSFSVSGSCNAVTRMVFLKGIHTESKKVIFEKGPFENGSENIAEFLAIIEAIKYCKNKRFSVPIYSKSQTAISWVKNRKTKTRFPRNEMNQQLFKLFNEAEEWIRNNNYPHKVLKWETALWGGNLADFGRK